MKYLANTFSPMMLGELEWAEVTPIELDELPPMSELTSVVSHEVTAKVLSALMGEEVPFNRINLTLELGDVLYCIIPNFRASEAREFSYEEVAESGYRCFQVRVSPKDDHHQRNRNALLQKAEDFAIEHDDSAWVEGYVFALADCGLISEKELARLMGYTLGE